jgi:hypothetical protein
MTRIYKDGLLYALKSLGDIHAFDLTSSTVTMRVVIGRSKRNIYESTYIIEAPWDDLLQVWRIVDVPMGLDCDDDVPEGEGEDVTEEDEDEDDTEKWDACTLEVKVYKVDM